MSSTGNEPNEAFWTSEHGHPQQNQQQFIAQDGSIPATSNSYYHPNAAGEAHGMSYGNPPPGDNFTVLSDGYGNFLKVYHQPSEDVVNLNNPAGKYEYELFSSNNSFIRPTPGFGFLFQPQQSQQQPPVSQSSNASHAQQNVPSETTGSNTSMLINQLVGNWAPTISGTYSPFGGGGPSLLAEGLPRSSEAYVQPQQQQQQPQLQQTSQYSQQQSVHLPQQQPSPEHQPSVAVSRTNNNSSASLSQPQPQQHQPSSANVSATASYNNQLNDDNSAKLNQNVKKQRIVAEVKPMRMSYSDVLSKNVPSSSATNSSFATSNMNGGSNANNGNGPSSKMQQSNNGVHSGGSGHSSNGNGKPGRGDKGQNKKASMQQPGLPMSDDKFGRRIERNAGVQKKATNTNNSNSSGYAYAENLNVSKQHMATSNGIEKTARKVDKNSRKTTKARSNEPVASNGAGRRNRLRNFNDEYTIQDVQGCGSPNKEHSREDTEDMEDDDDIDDDEEDDEDSDEYEEQQQSFMYNVKKNNNPNDTHIEKISGSRAVSKRGGRGSGAGRIKADKSFQQTNGKRGQRPQKSQKYVMIQKILNTWFQFMVFVVNWLWSLVSDVVYLSLRLCWDYLVAGYQYCEQYFVSMKQEFQQNRPGAWFKGVWQSFDNRFAKDSKWAFWRGKKKSTPVEEQTNASKNYYKDGRLPSTADEAMSSLLNCKGKDAYSILGVSPDCSQEQIRKHYKKIAVLVHPDKNKQPGAEEAFKVLQRSFELIGEPENRKSYDQSLAEALNAEKAWSEINDLLTQLHTKISEAANTIRCSSCCLRHPRKPTGRPHYAARECNSCKIRHSAREGDIWAETSFFGLRWKYLAMMEGNVYDITEWANCQKGALSHLQPNSHIVQYRIVLGGNSQQQQQNNQQHSDKDPNRSRKEPPASEHNLDDFLNNIYGGQNQQQQQQSQNGSRRRHRRN